MQEVGESESLAEFDWARGPRTETLFLRKKAQEINKTGGKIDIPKLIYGYTLEYFLQDDKNCFAWDFKGALYTPEKAAHAKLQLLERLDWEIHTPELPDYVRKRLEKTAKAVDELDWSNFATYQKARKVWFEARDWVEKKEASVRNIDDAMQYARDTSAQLKKPA